MLWCIICGLYAKLNNNQFFISRSSFSDFASKYGKDERFKGIEKMRDREGLFSDYVNELRRKEKEEKSSQKEKVCSKGGWMVDNAAGMRS